MYPFASMQGEVVKAFIHTAEGYLIIVPMSGQPHGSWQVTNDRQVDGYDS